MISVPTGELRRIDDMGVFATTAAFCILAYVWLFIVLKVWTPDQVTIAEAVLTILFFIILIILAFMADRFNAYKKKKQDKTNAKANLPIARRKTLSKDEYYRIIGIQQDKLAGNKKIMDDSEKIPLNQDGNNFNELTSQTKLDPSQEGNNNLISHENSINRGPSQSVIIYILHRLLNKKY